MKRFYSRKDLAQLLECSPAMVRKNEGGWGIKQYRCDLNTRTVRYKAAVIDYLKQKGFID